MKLFMPYCPDCKRRLQRRGAIDTHLPIQQIKWLYRCGGCMEEFIYHPFEAKVQPKQVWDEMRSRTEPS
jgi:hypothetical protein